MFENILVALTISSSSLPAKLQHCLIVITRVHHGVLGLVSPLFSMVFRLYDAMNLDRWLSMSCSS